MVTIFVLNKFIRIGNYSLLSGRYIWQHLHFVDGKNNGFTTDDWQENTVDFVQFLPGANFVCGVFEDCPVLDKFVKSRQTIRIC